MTWDLIGHQWAAQLLAHQIAAGTARHAYLFSGPPHVGRKSMALQFARAINCPSPIRPGIPCGECRSCKLIAKLQHPDISIIESAHEGAELKVDAIREVQSSLVLSPYEAKYRIAFLFRFHEATISAQNALLKTLEEAPEKVILLLTSDGGDLLLPTIVSRCEQVNLRPVSSEEIMDGLQRRYSIPVNEARFLAQVSLGRPGYAVNYHLNPDLLKKREEFLNDLWDLFGQTRRVRFSYAESKTKTSGYEDRESLRDSLRLMFQTWQIFWRDVMVRTAQAGAALTNPDQESRINHVAGRVSLSFAQNMVSLLEKSQSRLREANFQLLLEAVLLEQPRFV